MYCEGCFRSVEVKFVDSAEVFGTKLHMLMSPDPRDFLKTLSWRWQ